MRHHQAIEEINTLSFQPESGRWVSVTESRYRAGRKTRRKLFISLLLIGGFFYFYNPMHSYQPMHIEADGFELNTVEVTPEIISNQQKS